MKIHIVQKGDTMWKIAKRYGVDYQELLGANSDIITPDVIYPGAKIKIPSRRVPVRPREEADGTRNPAQPVKEAPLPPLEDEPQPEVPPQVEGRPRDIEEDMRETPEAPELTETPPASEPWIHSAPRPAQPLPQQPGPQVRIEGMQEETLPFRQPTPQMPPLTAPQQQIPFTPPAMPQQQMPFTSPAVPLPQMPDTPPAAPQPQIQQAEEEETLPNMSKLPKVSEMVPKMHHLFQMLPQVLPHMMVPPTPQVLPCPPFAPQPLMPPIPPMTQLPSATVQPPGNFMPAQPMPPLSLTSPLQQSAPFYPPAELMQPQQLYPMPRMPHRQPCPSCPSCGQTQLPQMLYSLSLCPPLPRTVPPYYTAPGYWEEPERCETDSAYVSEQDEVEEVSESSFEARCGEESRYPGYEREAPGYWPQDVQPYGMSQDYCQPPIPSPAPQMPAMPPQDILPNWESGHEESSSSQC